ncbi:MAG: hypothetical protein HQM03_15790 [Magnetococcales bacterium]|nr:hypothetical protein [Magnetococcales bacterium]
MNGEKVSDHFRIEEEIGVEVRRMLRGNMTGMAAPLPELSDQERRIFAEAGLGHAVEELLPSARMELRLTRSFLRGRKQGRKR